MKRLAIISSVILFLISCETKIENKEENNNVKVIPEKPIANTTLDTIHEKAKSREVGKKQFDSSGTGFYSDSLEIYYGKIGLVDIQSLAPQVIVQLKYSTTDNFVGIDMYGSLTKAFCQADVAEKLKKAYELLQLEDSSLTLLIFDAVRPVSVQQKMWDTLKIPLREKTKFLSNPKNHSIHNYGAAVDISLITKEGVELDMGTPFDFIGKLAHPREERRLLKEGKLTQKQVENRKLLRKVMKKAGFFNIQTEWWHWNSCSRNTAKKKYKVVR